MPKITIHIIWGELATSLYRRGVVDNNVRLAHAVYDFVGEKEGAAFLLGISEARKPHEWAQVTRMIDQRTLGQPLRSRLLDAIENGDLESVEQMLDSGVSPETKAPNGMTALQLAAQHGQDKIVESLLNRGANPEEPADSLNPHSAIHLASSSHKEGAQRVVDLLSSRNIDLERADKDGKTALMRAMNASRLDIATALVVHGAKTGTMDNDSRTARDLFSARYAGVVGDPWIDKFDATLTIAEGLALQQREKSAAMMRQPNVRPTPFGTRF